MTPMDAAIFAVVKFNIWAAQALPAADPTPAPNNDFNVSGCSMTWFNTALPKFSEILQNIRGASTILAVIMAMFGGLLLIIAHRREKGGEALTFIGFVLIGVFVIAILPGVILTLTGC